MAINLIPQVKFTSQVAFKQKESATKPDAATTQQEQSVSTDSKPGAKGFIAKIAYAWINATEMTKGFFGGLFTGGFVGTTIAAGDWLVSGLKKTGKKQAKGVEKFKFSQMFKKPTSALSKVGKIYAPIVAGVIFVGSLISARLKANQRTSNVDHQLKTGHRDK